MGVPERERGGEGREEEREPYLAVVLKGVCVSTCVCVCVYVSVCVLERTTRPLAGQGKAMRWLATLSCRGLLNGGSRTSTTGGTEDTHTSTHTHTLLHTIEYPVYMHVEGVRWLSG